MKLPCDQHRIFRTDFRTKRRAFGIANKLPCVTVVRIPVTSIRDS
jgi:hypothetical protein